MGNHGAQSYGSFKLRIAGLAKKQALPVNGSLFFYANSGKSKSSKLSDSDKGKPWVTMGHKATGPQKTG
jgi:hypothetical protein